MGDIPLSRKPIGAVGAQKIRARVQNTRGPDFTKLVTLAQAEAFYDFITIPEVNEPIYSIPRPISKKAITTFIQDHMDERGRGEGLLLARFAADGRIQAYFDIQIWPQWGACEIGGGMVPDLQNHGDGTRWARAIFDWAFVHIGVDLICETAALDNDRTKAMLGHLGFTYMGEVDCVAPSGKVRRSNYWEITRAQWGEKQD